MICALALEPLTQQSLSYPLRMLPDQYGAAAVQRTEYYNVYDNTSLFLDGTVLRYAVPSVPPNIY